MSSPTSVAGMIMWNDRRIITELYGQLGVAKLIKTLY